MRRNLFAGVAVSLLLLGGSTETTQAQGTTCNLTNVDTEATGQGPTGMAVAPRGRLAFVFAANYSTNEVTLLDLVQRLPY